MADIAFDEAPGEIRALLIEDGAPVEYHCRRALHAALGTIADARLVSRQGPRSFLTLASGEELLLPAPISESEGASIRVEIIRERLCGPGDVKMAVVRRSDADLCSISLADWRDAMAARSTRIISDSDAFDDVEALALAGHVVSDGVTIWFERTKAGLVFDVDGVGDAFAANRIAAHEIARLLRLFQSGGAALVDFITLDSKAERLAVAAAFDEASTADPRAFERTAINGFGLMQIIRPRVCGSLLDTLFGRNRLSPSDESSALALLRAASRSTGAGRRRCLVPPPVAALLSQPRWQPLVAEAARLAGASLDIVTDPSAPHYGHVHAEHN
jgi:ribonuclease G